MKFCLDCSEKLHDDVNICPKCGFNYTEFMGRSTEIRHQKKRRKILRDFSDEEILAMGLYPQNESYKMSLISRILGNR